MLNAGDVLSIHFETEKGALHLDIQAPDGNVLYSGNGQNAKDFTVNIAESGSYTVHRLFLLHHNGEHGVLVQLAALTELFHPLRLRE